MRIVMPRMGRKPEPTIAKNKNVPCATCNRQQACLGYFCEACGRSAQFKELYQFERHGTVTSVIGTRRCSCGERKWMFPCEVKNDIRRDKRGNAWLERADRRTQQDQPTDRANRSR